LISWEGIDHPSIDGSILYHGRDDPLYCPWMLRGF
jgi:hypothetical protein